MRRRAPGEGTIVRLKDGRWAAVVTLGYDAQGRVLRRKREAKSQDAAREKLRDLLHDLRLGITPVAQKSIATWILREWLPMVHARRRSATAGDYERSMTKYVVPWLRSRTFAQLTPADLERWYRELAEANVGPRAISKAHAALRAALAYAERTGLVHRNVASLIEPPQYEPPPRRRYSLEQVRAFLAQAEGKPGAALFTAALFLQLRSGELFALRWSDLDLKAGTVTVARTMTDDAKGRPMVGATTKTRAGLRTIALPKVVLSALRAQRKEHMGATYVFPDAKGGPLRRQNVGRRWLRPLQDAAGLPPITFHELRHTGASILKDLGADLMALRDRLGHESVTTTAQVYVHLDAKSDQKLSRLLDREYAGSNGRSNGLGKTRAKT